MAQIFKNQKARKANQAAGEPVLTVAEKQEQIAALEQFEAAQEMRYLERLCNWGEPSHDLAADEALTRQLQRDWSEPAYARRPSTPDTTGDEALARELRKQIHEKQAREFLALKARSQQQALASTGAGASAPPMPLGAASTTRAPPAQNDPAGMWAQEINLDAHAEAALARMKDAQRRGAPHAGRRPWV